MLPSLEMETRSSGRSEPEFDRKPKVVAQIRGLRISQIPQKGGGVWGPPCLLLLLHFHLDLLSIDPRPLPYLYSSNPVLLSLQHALPHQGRRHRHRNVGPVRSLSLLPLLPPKPGLTPTSLLPARSGCSTSPLSSPSPSSSSCTRSSNARPRPSPPSLATSLATSVSKSSRRSTTFSPARPSWSSSRRSPRRTRAWPRCVVPCAHLPPTTFFFPLASCPSRFRGGGARKPENAIPVSPFPPALHFPLNEAPRREKQPIIFGRAVSSQTPRVLSTDVLLSFSASRRTRSTETRLRAHRQSSQPASMSLSKSRSCPPRPKRTNSSCLPKSKARCSLRSRTGDGTAVRLSLSASLPPRVVTARLRRSTRGFRVGQG